MRFAFLLALLFSVIGCASSSSLSEDAARLGQRVVPDSVLAPPDSVASPTESARPPAALSNDEIYEVYRNNFVTEVERFIEDHDEAAGPQRTWFNVLTVAGLAIGTGGTIGSFIVEGDEATTLVVRSTSVAAGLTSGVVQALRLESKAARSETVVRYLESRLAGFKLTWPAGLTGVTDEDLEVLRDSISEVAQTVEAMATE